MAEPKSIRFVVVGASTVVAVVLGVVVAKYVVIPRANKALRVAMQKKPHRYFLEFRKTIIEASPELLSVFQQRNNETLFNILQKNANTWFGKEHNFSTLESVAEFRSNVPIAKYKDIQGAIERMCNGEKNVLSGEKVSYFATSSGTTGNQKMIPITSSFFTHVQNLMNASVGATIDYLNKNQDYQFTCLSKSGQIGFNPKTHKKTAGGIPYGALSQGMRAMPFPISFLISIGWKLAVEVPFGVTDQVTHFETNLLLQLLFCVMTEHLGHIFIAFGSILSHFFALLKIHFQELIQCIKDASLSPCQAFCANIPPDIISNINKYIISNYSKEQRSKRIAQLQEIEDFEGITRKLWPDILYVGSSVSGVFSVFENDIRFHLGDVPLMGAIYMSSEASMGFQFNIDGEYMFHPDNAFYEFITEEDISKEQPETLLLSELEVGKNYEVVLTTVSGFYRYRVGDVIHITSCIPCKPDIPLFKVLYRTGSILDAYGEKTTEEHVENALKRTAEVHDCSLVHFTSCLQVEVSPAVYFIYVEFSKELNEQEREGITDEVDTELRKVHEIYDDYRIQNKLGKLSCFVVASGTFAEFCELLVESGTAPLQVKVPHLITKKAHLDFFQQTQLTRGK